MWLEDQNELAIKVEEEMKEEDINGFTKEAFEKKKKIQKDSFEASRVR